MTLPLHRSESAQSDHTSGGDEETGFTSPEILQARKQKKRHLILTAKQFNQKPNKEYWKTYGEELGVLPPNASAKQIAVFLKETPGVDKSSLGDYISEPKDRRPFNNQVLEEFMKLNQFEGVAIDQGLRTLLGTFRLPGEAQKIERIMESFAACYYTANQHMGVYRSEDAVCILAYSIIMLHTDAHSDKIPVEKKMKEHEFVAQQQGHQRAARLPSTHAASHLPSRGFPGNLRDI